MLERAADDDLLVLEPKLSPEVDRNTREHEVPGVSELTERAVDPLVAALLGYVAYTALLTCMYASTSLPRISTRFS